MKKIILLLTIVLSTLMIISCKNETTEEHIGHHHNDEKAHPEEYVCQIGCEKGKIYERIGKCPVCKIDLIELEHRIGDVHDYPSYIKSKPDNNIHNHNNVEIDQEY